MSEIRELDFTTKNIQLDHDDMDGTYYYTPFKRCHIMQYTGLLDKSGKEIYEGDVLSFDGHTNEEKFIASVVFKDGKFVDSLYGWDIGKYREIIGNIHQNPELLK